MAGSGDSVSSQLGRLARSYRSNLAPVVDHEERSI
jgi:hypothetical protein